MSKLDDPTSPGDLLPPDPPAMAAQEPEPPPSNELQEWRRRALEAEALADQLAAEVESLRAQLDSTDRAHTVESLLTDAGALDANAARAVLDARLAQSPSGDLAVAVDELRRALPFLFRAPPASTAPARSAMTAAPSSPAPNFDDLDAALELASTTGDRAALLRYLRLRRAV